MRSAETVLGFFRILILAQARERQHNPLLMLGRGAEPQFPVSRMSARVSNLYSDDPSVPESHSLSAQHSVCPMRQPALYCKTGLGLDDFVQR